MTLRKIPEYKPPVVNLKPIKPKAKLVPAKPPTVPTTDRNLSLRQNNLRGDTLKVGLLNKYQTALNGAPQNLLPQLPVPQNPVPQNPVPPVPPVDPGRVDAAVSSIKDSLSQGILDWDVTHGDLDNIKNQFNDLNPSETNAAFDDLSADDLKNWNQELNGLSGGYDKDERQQVFNDLAAKLNGGNAARMFGAMENELDKQAFAHSVGQNAAPQAKTDFINAQLGSVETDKNAALAVAEVIGGMKNNPAELQGVLSQMSPAQLTAVMKSASVETTTYSPDGVPVTSFDPAPLAAMIDAAAGISNPEMKADVFQNGALEMKRIGDAGGIFNPTFGNETEGVRDALTNLLNSDTTGVTTALEANYRDGNGLTAYVKEMLDSDQAPAIGQLIAKLAKGNSLTENPMTRFNAESIGSDGKPFKQNAQVLGFFSGAVLAAAKQITTDEKAQGDILKNVFGTIAGAAGAANPAAGVASSILNGLTSATVDAVGDQVSNHTLSLAEGLAKLSFPQDPATGKPYNGGTEADYDSAVGRVLDHNPAN